MCNALWRNEYWYKDLIVCKIWFHCQLFRHWIGVVLHMWYKPVNLQVLLQWQFSRNPLSYFIFKLKTLYMSVLSVPGIELSTDTQERGTFATQVKRSAFYKDRERREETSLVVFNIKRNIIYSCKSETNTLHCSLICIMFVCI